ncbi:hypothetical protein BpHYR1_051641 [Brachionus plicatilis]|uniref:Uncharacterized protein n=1 Tax=Brachionus plicatilis TaxID=10195 RepID=A0A3M7S0K6_BRAPC|nr:hypothetical protein BpHYR1_051641 [Brachionus plicatilis]
MIINAYFLSNKWYKQNTLYRLFRPKKGRNLSPFMLLAAFYQDSLKYYLPIFLLFSGLFSYLIKFSSTKKHLIRHIRVLGQTFFSKSAQHLNQIMKKNVNPRIRLNYTYNKYDKRPSRKDCRQWSLR